MSLRIHLRDQADGLSHLWSNLLPIRFGDALLDDEEQELELLRLGPRGAGHT